MMQAKESCLLGDCILALLLRSMLQDRNLRLKLDRAKAGGKLLAVIGVGWALAGAKVSR